MADANTPPPLPKRFVKAFTARPRLLIALGVGLLAYLVLLVDHDLRWVTRAVIAWDVACLVYVVSIVQLMWSTSTDDMRRRAATQDVGQGVILGLAVIAAIASTAAVAAELAAAKNTKGLEEIARVGLGFFTVVASWAFTQFIFALHYAHEYYAPDDEGDDPQQGGLDFPGCGDPDYWDFLHFAMIIGVANQTADISFTAKSLRRIGTVHGVLAFLFNTGVLALTINMLAGLIT
jgi:uncharacterized membrane protein